MKTINKLYISLILLSSSLLAADKSYSFIGIQTGSSFIGGDAVANIGLKYGLQTRKYRTTFSYAYGQKSNANYHSLLAQIDTGIFANSFKRSNFKPYAGFAFGVMQEKNKLSSVTDKGYVYGADMGLAYIFNDALDFDLAYRYLQTSKLENIDSVSDLTLSVHYFY